MTHSAPEGRREEWTLEIKYTKQSGLIYVSTFDDEREAEEHARRLREVLGWRP